MTGLEHEEGGELERYKRGGGQGLRRTTLELNVQVARGSPPTPPQQRCHPGERTMASSDEEGSNSLCNNKMEL
ncbi:UNVERIFIED_CONTAM: hypothetical protein K2H54_045486 [Gekko kuhli]